jgi:hypothetical protein
MRNLPLLLLSLFVIIIVIIIIIRLRLLKTKLNFLRLEEDLRMCKKRGPGNKLRMLYSLPAGGVGGHDRLGHVVDPHQVLEKEKKAGGWGS